MAMAFSPDGKILAAGGMDGTVRVWDVASGDQLHKLEGPVTARYVPSGISSTDQFNKVGGRHRAEVWSVAFSPDGKHLVCGGQDKLIRVWDVSTGKELGQFRGHDGTVVGLAFSPDGKFLASTSIDMTGLVWDFGKFRR